MESPFHNRPLDLYAVTTDCFGRDGHADRAILGNQTVDVFLMSH